MRDDDKSPSDACASRSRSSSTRSESRKAESSFSFSRRETASEAEVALVARLVPRAASAAAAAANVGDARPTNAPNEFVLRVEDGSGESARVGENALLFPVAKTPRSPLSRSAVVSAADLCLGATHPASRAPPIEASLVSLFPLPAVCAISGTARGAPRLRRSERICAPSQRRGRTPPPRAAAPQTPLTHRRSRTDPQRDSSLGPHRDSHRRLSIARHPTAP
mmetsp:Transcript_13835/g.59207  ORF Transcript_13835/g.59207 Transcript_13835/m.59207 type:complete len:222 (+) Transcript_13835:1613-2278(+)